MPPSAGPIRFPCVDNTPSLALRLSLKRTNHFSPLSIQKRSRIEWSIPRPTPVSNPKYRLFQLPARISLVHKLEHLQSRLLVHKRPLIKVLAFAFEGAVL